MKILLLGDFSGLHGNLKDGLLEHGHDVAIAGWKDGFKEIPVDFSFDSNRSGLLGGFERLLKPLAYLNKFRGYDLVQLISPFIFHYHTFPHKYLFPTTVYINSLRKNNSKFFFLATADDAYFWQVARKKLRYGPFDDYIRYDNGGRKSYHQSASAMKYNNLMLSKCDGIIPVIYEYQIGLENSKKLRPLIPLPVNTNKICYKENIVGKKVRIFHGLNRYGFKGTRHIEKAFEKLRKKYPKDLELIIDGKMPLKKYLNELSKANIVIDQANSYSCGMNALLSMAMGKVVLGGNEPEALASTGCVKSPVINILPCVDSIERAIMKLLDTRAEIPKIGLNSRTFVEKVHDYRKIAQLYLKEWMQ